MVIEESLNDNRTIEGSIDYEAYKQVARNKR